MIAPSQLQGFSAGALALLMHGLFLTALVFSVSWKALPEMPVYADLWNALPPLAGSEADVPSDAQPPVPPLMPEMPPPPPRAAPIPELQPAPPPPRTAPAPPPAAKPDIVLEADTKAREEARRKEEAQRQEQLARQAAEETRRREEARQLAQQHQQEELRLAEEQLRQETARRADATRREALEQARRELDAEMARQAQADLARESAQIRRTQDRIVLSARVRTILEYQERIRRQIQSVMTRCDQVPGNPEVVYKVQLLPTGEILRMHMERSSGNAICDQLVERAILKASPLPLPVDKEAARDFLREPLELKSRPNEDPATEARG